MDEFRREALRNFKACDVEAKGVPHDGCRLDFGPDVKTDAYTNQTSSVGGGKDIDFGLKVLADKASYARQVCVTDNLKFGPFKGKHHTMEVCEAGLLAGLEKKPDYFICEAGGAKHALPAHPGETIREILASGDLGQVIGDKSARIVQESISEYGYALDEVVKAHGLGGAHEIAAHLIKRGYESAGGGRRFAIVDPDRSTTLALVRGNRVNGAPLGSAEALYALKGADVVYDDGGDGTFTCLY